MKYVISKLTGAQDYNFYVPGTGEGVNLVSCTIHVNGGANVADKHFITPDGVITELTDEQAERLKTHPVFSLHEKNGFVKIRQNIVYFYTLSGKLRFYSSHSRRRQRPA